MLCREFYNVAKYHLGEGGVQALYEAIQFYLMNASDDDFGCELDKLILLSLLLGAPECNNFIDIDYDPLANFHISFDKPSASADV